MKPILFHPSRRALRAWLLGEDADAKLDAHVAVCKRCANTLEQLDTDDVEGSESDLAGALAIVLAPPDDLSVRLEDKVTQRLDSRVMFGVLSDMFAAGIETSKMLILDEVDDPEQER